ncbi:MAG: class B sortase [Clostridia bacterium]|nr:class B sortase [Clostridia bacterium]
MNNEKDTKRKKVMYVPDEELLSVNKIENDGDPEIAVVEEDNVETYDKKKVGFFSRVAGKIIPSKRDDKKTVIVKLVAIVAALALIGSAVYLSLYFGDLSVQDGKIENVRNNYELNRDDYTRNEDNQFSKFDYLKTLNPDVIGWISIDNTEVNNPVYQTIDNQYYVDHDMDKKKNTYGALFLDYRCNIDPKALTQNQIIYGHNMRYGAMFGSLDEYRDIEFAKKSAIIKFDSLYEQRAYKIFAIMIVNDAEDETFGYSYTAYRSEFTGDTDFLQWVDRSKQRSLYDFPVDVNAEDEVITLSTCCYDYTNARFVILARLVREGEDSTVDASKVIKNDDVIYSKEYYNKKKLPIPNISSSTASTTDSSKKADSSK